MGGQTQPGGGALPSPSQGEGEGEGTRWLHSLGLLDMIEPIPRDLEMADTMMMGLRLMEGVSDAEFARRFGIPLRHRYGPIIADLVDLGLLHWQGEALALTPRGHLLGNEVFQRFVAE